MPHLTISTSTDPRIANYSGIRDRVLMRQSGLFVVEGEHLVGRLLESEFEAESILVAESRAGKFAESVPEEVPLYVAADDIIESIVGYKFHRGVMALGKRKPGLSLTELAGDPSAPVTLVICRGVSDPENMGSILRISAALGADGVLVGERCCDPFVRRSVRVSMGTVFSLPITVSRDLLADLDWLRQEGGVEFAATILSPEAKPLHTVARPPRLGIVLGSEADGIDAACLTRCVHPVTIPMAPGVDSLNVAVAAGIILHHFTKWH
jgi:tRNA G18 (ribose-2'-O)-methylase SpoU